FHFHFHHLLSRISGATLPSSLPLAPVSTPLFAFSTDGTVAWMRESGARLVAVDRATGEVLREVRLEPAPFGIGWRVERHGAFFVVRDDREIAAYADASGARLWKRTSPKQVAFAGERDGRHVSVIPSAGGDGIDIALADLATGAFDTKIHVGGTMQHVGAHGTIAGDLLFFATDQRDVLAVDLGTWQVVHTHHVDGSHALPPIATSSGVHVASVERREAGSVTHVTTLDRVTGSFVSRTTVPGAAHLLTRGSNGLVLESRRSPNGPVERIAFRPETPSVRLTVAKHVDVRLVRTDAPQIEANPRRLAASIEATLPSNTSFEGHAEVLLQPARNPRGAASGAREEIVPAPRDGTERRAPTPHDGLLGMLALLEARSDVLTRMADAFEARSGVFARVQRLGITLRDPRARWTMLAGRDPCLLDIAENREGDSIATYFYPHPRAKNERVPVVLVSRATGDARWLADDVDVWFAGVLHNATAYAPDAVRIIVAELGLARDFPQPLANAIPPPWFFEAHATPWTLDDADAALAAGDVEGAERMLVAVGRTSGGDYAQMARVKERLASVYAMLGWDHHRATVVETW
ncbi:MAG: hypothetical protein JWP87_6414, partial [Labilithrix sp.]|nr:hypothetical protein [Labilithrix sp.]